MAETQRTTNTLESFREGLTGYAATIGSDHAYIHKGQAFTIAIDLGSISGATHIRILTPAATSGYLHFRPTSAGITSDANAVEYMFREMVSATYTGGSAYVPFNRNRNSTRASAAVVTSGVSPTITTAITLDTVQAGTTGNPTALRGGATGGGADELVLKPETSYLITLTPAGATNVSFTVYWYEETYGSV